MGGKKSSFYISDEFNGNGKNIYLRATTRKTYTPLSEKDVRLTPDFKEFVQQAIEAVPLVNNPQSEYAEVALKVVGSLASTGQVMVKKDESTGDYDLSFNMVKIRLTTGSYLHESKNKKANGF